MESFSPLLIFPFPCGSKPLSSGSHDAFGHQSSPEVSLVLEGLESISGQARSSHDSYQAPLSMGFSRQEYWSRDYLVPSSDKEAGFREVWSILDSFPTVPPFLA